jgi:GNAT superfamily N-acetyltransferase
VEDAPVLSDLALRSKAHWGYTAAFIEACRDDLTMSGDAIKRGHVFVLEDDEGTIGFYALWGTGDQALLTDLFVKPERIGCGYGRRLWGHAVETACRLGYAAMTVHSDPHAEGFYRAMGAVRTGVVPSTVCPDRFLPLMHVPLR